MGSRLRWICCRGFDDYEGKLSDPYDEGPFRKDPILQQYKTRRWTIAHGYGHGTV